MKVKVTPPYEGAGSWEAEQVDTCLGFCRMKDGAQYPSSWCEEIPSITPEPGDICQAYINDEIFVVDKVAEGKCFERDWYWPIGDVRVLARKPKGHEEARDACADFVVRWVDGAIPQRVAAYERFLAEILGVPYARVGE